MRLWSIDLGYLDAKGLVALWRETLLAQKVLRGETVGYKNHPQLIRFRATPNPTAAIATYLRTVLAEAQRRGYNFDSSKIMPGDFDGCIEVTSGQLDYEFRHLLKKLQKRDPAKYEVLSSESVVRPNLFFKVIDGAVESWEIQ